MSETKAEEIARLQREIAERQQRLQFLVLGDPAKGVTITVETSRQWGPFEIRY